MKSELIKKEEKEFFPILKINKMKTYVVLFYSMKEGTVVWRSNDSCEHLGRFKNNFVEAYDMTTWETFKGEIKLSN